MKTLSIFFVIGIAIFSYLYLNRPITHAPGVLISIDPTQTLLSESKRSVYYGEFSLKPLARFSIDARVLHRKVYRFDRWANLVPVDLALGWGAMSNEAVLNRMKISQSMRFYWYEYQSPP